MANLYNKTLTFMSKTLVSDEMGGVKVSGEVTVTSDVPAAVQPVDEDTRIAYGRLGINVTDKAYIGYTTTVNEQHVAVDEDSNEFRIEKPRDQGGRGRVLRIDMERRG